MPVPLPYIPRVGDLVSYYADPPNDETLWLEVIECPPGESMSIIRVRQWGSNTADWGESSSQYTGDLKFVKRPPEGKRFISPLPCPPTRGYTGAHLSRDFVLEVVEWVASHQTLQARIAASSSFKAFLAGGSPALRRSLDSEIGLIECPNVLMSQLTRILNAYDGENERCVECAELMLARWVQRVRTHVRGTNAPDACQHFRCAECGTLQLEACDTCSTLYRTTIRQPLGTERICEHCCDHDVCGCSSICHEMIRVRSSPCGHAAGHCTCPRCEIGGCTRPQLACCGRCNRHCGCRYSCFPMSDEDDRHEEPVFFRAKPLDRMKLTRVIGTELETAGAARYSKELREARAKWQFNVVGDGSIDPGGVELVTQPAGGTQWREMIADIGKGLQTSGAFTSPKCGQHVHVDASDLNVWDMRRLIKLYASIEQALFDALPYERIQSRYCVPCGSTYLNWLQDMGAKPQKLHFAFKQYSVKPQDYLRHRKAKDYKIVRASLLDAKKALDGQAERKYHESRYKALNLHSYWHRGTIEFRHAHGTCNPEQITNWGLICASIVDFAAKQGDAQVKALLDVNASVGGWGRPVLTAILDHYGLQDVKEWLTQRWAKFTHRPGSHKDPQPQRDPTTGEV